MTHTITFFSFYLKEKPFLPRSIALNSSLLAQLFFLVSDSGWNVLWEVFNTSEAEQEAGGAFLEPGSRKPRWRPLGPEPPADKGRPVWLLASDDAVDL